MEYELGAIRACMAWNGVSIDLQSRNLQLQFQLGCAAPSGDPLGSFQQIFSNHMCGKLGAIVRDADWADRHTVSEDTPYYTRTSGLFLSPERLVA